MDESKLRKIAWVGDHILRKPIRGIVLRFQGLGDAAMKDAASYAELECGDAGALIVLPYLGPWYWMNRESRAETDEIVESLYKIFKLADDIPLILTGGSLGGYAALLYARYAKRPVKACYALFPVTDVKYSFSERPDVARTVYSAFRGYKEDMEALFIEHSPLSQVDKMPRIPYMLVHGALDVAVSKKAHSDPFVAAMRARGHDVTYREVPDLGHQDLNTYALHREAIDFVKNNLKK